MEGGHQTVQADEQIVGTSGVCDLQRRVRDLERLLGRKSMEVKIHKAASVSQAQGNQSRCSPPEAGR